MVMVMQVRLIESLSDVINKDGLVLLDRATMKAPKAPTAPASDGAKIPAYRPPITSRNNSSIPQIPVSEANLSFQEKLSPRGPSLGFRIHIININAKKQLDRSNPGNIPAINKVPIGCAVRKP